MNDDDAARCDVRVTATRESGLGWGAHFYEKTLA